jgi:general secretion pathway protein D
VAGRQFGSVAANGGAPASPFGVDNSAPSSANGNITSGLRDASSIQANAVDTLLASSGFSSLAAPQDQVATIQGILTNPRFQVVIQALSQKSSTDILSAPKITTISGAQAQVRVVQEFIYPTEFQQAQVVAAGGGNSGGGAVGVTPSIPSAFKTREVGVLLNVTPTVGADGYTINLTLIPEVSQFLGFINYGGPISVAAGNNVITTFNDIKQPLFSSENLTTSIVIWDGQTVVLGGLITENVQKIDDKVPFLGDMPLIGRLFRTKVTQRQKENLLIFVTARLIDPAGNPIHREDTASLH